jgi:hypothetical protein
VKARPIPGFLRRPMRASRFGYDSHKPRKPKLPFSAWRVRLKNLRVQLLKGVLIVHRQMMNSGDRIVTIAFRVSLPRNATQQAIGAAEMAR